MTPIHIAGMRNQVEYMKLCIEYNKSDNGRKFDFNAIEHYCGYSLLHLTTISCSVQVMIQLVNLNIDPFVVDKLKRTPRQLSSNRVIRKLLIRKEMSYYSIRKNGSESTINTKRNVEFEEPMPKDSINEIRKTKGLNMSLIFPFLDRIPTV